MKIGKIVVCTGCLLLAIVGCQSTPKEPKVSVDDSIQALACELAANAIESNRLNGDKRPVLAFGRIQNDTMSVTPACLDLMKSRIAEMFSGSGLVRVLPATESMNQGANRPMPTHILHGRIAQRETMARDGRKQVMYTLQLSISDVPSGMRVWNGQRSVGFAID